VFDHGRVSGLVGLLELLEFVGLLGLLVFIEFVEFAPRFKLRIAGPSMLRHCSAAARLRIFDCGLHKLGSDNSYLVFCVH
jgi:hypothetical protein